MSIAASLCANCNQPTSNKKLCTDCGRERKRQYYARNKDNPNHRFELRAKKMAKAKVKRDAATQEEIEAIAITAPIPNPVFKPYLERVLRECAQYEQSGGTGYTKLSEWTGVDDRVFSRIINETGESWAVSLDVADRVCQQFDFSLDELYHRALEWAELTGDPWPFGY